MLIALLPSFGGGISEVEAGGAKVTVTIRRPLEDDGSGEIRQFPGVKAANLKVIAWATEHREDSPTDYCGEDWPQRVAMDGGVARMQPRDSPPLARAGQLPGD
ncbi:hypothetical protein HPB48_022167 [Haemaphysalis longicornis]|uniref:Uncharacterized protein n=1 Tax=Haemaphysalis longicornis TaxID=44386 RepID=A0A9J6FI91_HAELO|nr:hypothetical protein HPB48_022167 [Haemaphysalis longicornis]